MTAVMTDMNRIRYTILECQRMLTPPSGTAVRPSRANFTGGVAHLLALLRSNCLADLLTCLRIGHHSIQHEGGVGLRLTLAMARSAY